MKNYKIELPAAKLELDLLRNHLWYHTGTELIWVETKDKTVRAVGILSSTHAVKIKTYPKQTKCIKPEQNSCETNSNVKKIIPIHCWKQKETNKNDQCLPKCMNGQLNQIE